MTFLHWIGNTLRGQLDQVSLSAARWSFITVFLLLMFWVVQLPSTQTMPEGKRSNWYEDLRIWAWLALIFQVVIYSVF